MSKHNGDLHASDIPPEQLTAYALGQLHGEELASVKAAVGEADHDVGRGAPDPAQRLTEGLASRRGQETCAEQVRQVQTLAAAITSARAAEPLPKPSVELREAIESKLAQMEVVEKVEPAANQRRWWRPTAVEWVVGGGIGVLLLALCVPAVQMSRLAAQRAVASNSLKQLGIEKELRLDAERRAVELDGFSRNVTSSAVTRPTDSTTDDTPAFEGQADFATIGDGASNTMKWNVNPHKDGEANGVTLMVKPRIVPAEDEPLNLATRVPASAPTDPAALSGDRIVVPATESLPAASYGGFAPAATASAGGLGAGYGGPGGARGGQSSGYPGAQGISSSGVARGYAASSSSNPESLAGGGAASNPVPGTTAARVVELDKVHEDSRQDGWNYQFSKRTAGGTESRKFQNQLEREAGERGVRLSRDEYELAFRMRNEAKSREFPYGEQVGSEQYESITENAFLSPLADPLSTFSIDVDTASYANVRRFLNEGRLPPPAAVRIEELVNYFNYSYPQPTGKEPFSVNMEAAECPWNAGHLLLRVGLKGKEVHRSERPPSNLTFLLDVSGSMQDANKLPLLKTTLMMFVAELTENDRVSIVTYAGEAGLRLPPTLGHEKEKIMAAIDSLSAGGSTHGSEGIQLAYEQAGQYFLKEGTNRVILATDGDLNVGVTSDDALVELIKEKATGGTFLTVLGFGTGNLKDGKLEKLADNGNGVYAYIDGVREGRKVLVEQMSGNLVTIAKDVKIQIEFNPAQIASYRLLGYENRVLAAADFNNDKKDAGEIGAGHTVTALYELVPVGTKEVAAAPQVGEPLKYQASGVGGQESGAVGNGLRGVPGDVRLSEAAASGELLTLKLRYKEPDGVESRLVEFPLKERGGQFHSASKDLQFAAAVASFGMILRGSEHRGSGSLPAVAEIASGALDSDQNGYRAEFVDLVRKAQLLGAK